MDFDEAVTWLDDHLNLEKWSAVAGRVEGLSLEPMRRLVGVLGDPQDAYPVIHLTGTNGKGSTARMISALLAAHDLSVGTYTSPHLEHVTERIAWNLAPITTDELARVLTELAALEPLVLEELRDISDQRPSYFELLTAAAYSYFADIAVDVAVMEVGMLGRWDATNVANGPLAVITNIGKDHTNAQGDWRRRIAEEKAGVITEGGRLVLGETDPVLLPVFEAEGPGEIWLRDRDFACAGGTVALGGRVVDIRTPLGSHDQVFLPFHGAHQADNAACAVAAVEAFFGRALDTEVIQEAFSDLRLPGRFEVLHRGPLVVLDGAHNPDGARAAAQTLDEEFSVDRRCWVLGMVVGRDVDEMLDMLGIGTGQHPDDQVIACTPPVTRALPADELATHVAKRGVKVDVVPDIERAVAQAVEDMAAVTGDVEGPTGGTGPSGAAVIVTGSLYTVGAARTACRRLGLLQ